MFWDSRFNGTWNCSRGSSLTPDGGLTCVFTRSPTFSGHFCSPMVRRFIATFPIVQIKKAESEAVSKCSIRATVEAATVQKNTSPAPPRRSNPSETDAPSTHLNPDKLLTHPAHSFLLWAPDRCTFNPWWCLQPSFVEHLCFITSASSWHIFSTRRRIVAATSWQSKSSVGLCELI